jgi:protein-L-isoaspartate(D-aspartate) O-methyltransferase
VGDAALMDRRYERARRELIEAIRDRGIEDLEVLRSFDVVPRHLFLPESAQHRAYEDAPIPIGYGQTASQPSLQALYLKKLRLTGRERVLEIGTGSGFQTALLASLAAQVYSVERIGELSHRARRALDAVRVGNVALLVGDGTVGWTRYAPYDAIVVTAGAPSVPAALTNQLAADGRLLIPVGDRERQRLLLVRREGDALVEEEVTDCSFVPLLGRFGWAGPA